MASKTLNVSVQAYAVAEAHKRPGESFSELLLRSFRPTSLLDLAGILTAAQADELEAAVKDGRAQSRAREDKQSEHWA